MITLTNLLIGGTAVVAIASLIITIVQTVKFSRFKTYTDRDVLELLIGQDKNDGEFKNIKDNINKNYLAIDRNFDRIEEYINSHSEDIENLIETCSAHQEVLEKYTEILKVNDETINDILDILEVMAEDGQALDELLDELDDEIDDEVEIEIKTKKDKTKKSTKTKNKNK